MLRQKESRLGRLLAAVILTAVIMAAYLLAGADTSRNYAMSDNNGERYSSVGK